MKKTSGGFTIAEMAIVVLLIGIAMTMGLKMVTANLDNSAYSETKAKQDLIKTALIGYLRTNKALPCPDTAIIPTGAPSAPCAASAGASSGAVPWATLGLPKDTAIDGWGNFFVYKVANGFGPVVKDWTSFAAVKSFDINELAFPSLAIVINEGDGVTPLAQITNKAVVAIVSFGKNGFDAKTIQGQANSAPPAINIDETTNGTFNPVPPIPPTYVRRPYSEKAAALGGSYDDLVAYMTPQDLLQPLVNEKTIQACYGYCAAAGVPAPGPGCVPTQPIPVGKPAPASCL